MTATYELVLLRSRIAPSKLRQNDVESQLLQLGMCNSCAGNAASFYIKKPNSRCAKLVKQALEGNPDARTEISASPEYCNIQ